MPMAIARANISRSHLCRHSGDADPFMPFRRLTARSGAAGLVAWLPASGVSLFHSMAGRNVVP